MMLRKLESEDDMCGERLTFDTKILEGRSVADLNRKP
jgi:hypothetical protein